MESSTAAKRAVDAATIAEAFRITAGRSAGRGRGPHQGRRVVAWTWGELRERVDALAGGLHALGAAQGRHDRADARQPARVPPRRPRGDDASARRRSRSTRPYAPDQIATSSATPARGSSSPSRPFLDNVLEAREELPDLEHVIVVDGEAPEGVDDARRRVAKADGAASTSRPSRRRIDPDDVLTLIYTSGTTGPPKGVQLAHRNLLAAVERHRGADRASPRTARVISWLPSAHIAERAAHHYLPIVFGFRDHLLPRPAPGRRLPAAGAPELVLRGAAHLGEAQGRPGGDASPASPTSSARPRRRRSTRRIEKVRLEQAGEQVPAELAERVAAADEEMFAGLRAMLGLDQVEAINVGAAPTPVEVLEFFHAIGLPLAELWGMSETCGAGTVNPPDRDQDRHGRPARAGRRDQARRRRRGAGARRRRHARLPQPAREDGRGDRRRRLAAHRRHRRVRRRRLPEDRRPQEGADHQRGRQEHVAGQHRGDAQGRLAADRPGRRDRRRAARTTPR